MRPLNFNSHVAQTNGVVAGALHGRARNYPANFLLDNDARERAADCARLESELRRAVERDELEVYYQPVVALATGRLKGFEALVRWRHAGRGILPPSEFIPLAERTRIINDIGGWVLFEACRQMSEWRELLPASRVALSVGVNISVGQLARAGLVELIERTLEETNLPPRCLKLEINESALARGGCAAFDALTRLRSLGVRLAVDDFGTGLSSLRQLRCLPFDTLKIDRSLVSRAGVRVEDAQGASAAVALASSLGLTVVAKRVETDEQRERLGALGCEYAQGFLYSKPVDAETTLALVRRDLRTQYTHGLAPRDADRSLSRLTQVLAA
ncbi:MAG TPA: EAL domain-containing protein [Pyrinomonadaceae bacterium]|nr:EAL domain-containing protein [Pyrinomonadaceae bacterium]